jgi:hypothetical protein
MNIKYPEIAICGLSCRLCPHYHTEGPSRCEGCKTESRMGAGCPFITCARKKGVEFCWDCKEHDTCEKWAKHRESGKKADSFKCYQKLEDDIAFVRTNGIEAFERTQETRERLLRKMLDEFNDGRSKSYYCIAATVMEIGELESALAQVREDAGGMDRKERARALHTVLDGIAAQRNYCLNLRKQGNP